MQLKTLFFEPTLAKKGLKRTMPLWITHFVIWLFAMPVMLANVMNYGYGAVPDMLEVSEYVYHTVFIGGTLMSCFFCAVIAGVLNNYLMSARSVSFYHALPVQRSAHFGTNLIVTLGTVLVPSALVGLLTWIVELSMGVTGGGIYILKWFGIYALMCIFFTGFALLCIHVTGHVAAAPIIYAILNFTALAVEMVIRYLPSLFLYGVQTGSNIAFGWLSPIYHIYAECGVKLEYDWIGEDRIASRLIFQNADYLFGLAAAGIVLTLLAYAVYRIRHSESAGEFVAIDFLRPVFKYCVTAGFTLILSIVLYAVSYMARVGEDDPSALWFTVCMLVAGAIGYFGSEMLLQKSFRVLKKGLPGFAVCAVLICLGGATLQFDLLGIERYIPNGEDVSYVELYTNYRDYEPKLLPSDTGYDYAAQLHQLILDNKEQNKQICFDRYYGGPVDNNNYRISFVEFRYYMVDGSRVDRSYRVPLWQYTGNDPYVDRHDTFGYMELLNQIYDHPELIKRAYPAFWEEDAFYTLYHASAQPHDSWTATDMLDNHLYAKLEDAVRADLLAGTLTNNELVQKYEKDLPNGPSVYSLNLEFEKIVADPDNNYPYRSYYFTVTPAAVNTYAILSDPANYIDNTTAQEGVMPASMTIVAP